MILKEESWKTDYKTLKEYISLTLDLKSIPIELILCRIETAINTYRNKYLYKK